jgi:hypothetical protein
MPSRETAQSTEHGVDGCWIVGIESHAPDESAGQVAGDIGKVQAAGHQRIRGDENLRSDRHHDVVAV